MQFTGDLRQHDWRGKNLAGAHFLEADLYWARFDGCDLEGATFTNCFVAEASFEKANCARLRARGSSFYRSSFRGASLRDALLWNCVLAGSDLRDADLKGVTLTLDCNSFEEVRLDHAASAELAYLFGRARSPHSARWLEVVGEEDIVRLERVFLR
jgi:uncharacterized protein YjbI with pentapeptide repeats